MLLLLYGTLTCLFVGGTMIESLVRVVGEPKVDVHPKSIPLYRKC